MKIATGIPGFDRIVNGGFNENTINLISGETGTCKSIFCMQFLYNRAKKFKENVCYITTDECRESIIRQSSQFGWDLEKLKDNFKILQMEPYKVNHFLAYIEQLRKSEVKRVVIDSVSIFEIFVKDPFMMRKSFYSMIEGLRNDGRVTLMTTEIPHGTKNLSRSEIIEFMADTVIMMQYIQAAKIKRSLIVKKMRFSSHSENAHPFQISKGGLAVR